MLKKKACFEPPVFSLLSCKVSNCTEYVCTNKASQVVVLNADIVVVTQRKLK